MTSYTDALSVITTLTTSSPWYCVAACWWCLVLHLLKNHVPLDYPLSCTAGKARTISSIQDYTHFHWFCWLSVGDVVWPGILSLPFPNLVLLSACPWQHHDTPLLWLLTKGGDIHDLLLLLRKCSTFIYALFPTDGKGQDKQRQSMLNPVGHPRHSSRLGLQPSKTRTNGVTFS